MPVIIDGYNLYHTLNKPFGHANPPGRQKLCTTLAEWSRITGEHVVIVFDGTRPRGFHLERDVAQAIDVVFSGPGKDADRHIADHITAHSHPKRLLVVTNDRWILRAATRRKCPTAACETFWNDIEATLNAPPPPPPVEPDQKRTGATDEKDTEYWMEQFGYDSDAGKDWEHP